MVGYREKPATGLLLERRLGATLELRCHCPTDSLFTPPNEEGCIRSASAFRIQPVELSRWPGGSHLGDSIPGGCRRRGELTAGREERPWTGRGTRRAGVCEVGRS